MTQSTEPQNASARAVDAEVISRLFMALHGYFGNAFLQKFQLGEKVSGKDTGVENAKRVWESELQGFTVIEAFGALRKIRDSGATFPPSLPEFVSACRACRAPKPFAPDRALPAPSGNVLKRLIASDGKEKPKSASDGLSTLFACIGNAVSAAGGDEVAALRRLECDMVRR